MSNLSVLNDGFGGYLVLAMIGFLVHEPWRWLGLVLGRNLTVDSEMFLWVRSVAAALIAGLVFRLMLFPVGALANVSPPLRTAALVLAGIVFFATKRSMGLAVAAGALSIIGLQLVAG